MPFTQEQETGILNALKNKAHSCPNCHHRRLTLSPDLYYLPMMTVGDGQIRMRMDRGIPMVCLVCLDCAHVITFHLLGLGVGHLFGLTSTDKQSVP